MDRIQEEEVHEFDLVLLPLSMVLMPLVILLLCLVLPKVPRRLPAISTSTMRSLSSCLSRLSRRYPAASVCPTIQLPRAVKLNARPSLRDRLASSVTEVTNNRGLIESICGQIIVEATPLHGRIEKKASTLAGATAKLVSVDPEFKLLCKDFADNFESYSGVVLKFRVLEMLDILQNTYELTDDQAAFSILMFSTSRLRKRGDKSLHNAAMTMRILGSIVSASDSELPDRLLKLEAGILDGDLSGGERLVTIRIVLTGLSLRGLVSCRIW